jgi:maltooligosyltrehalose trehalohydrolase
MGVTQRGSEGTRGASVVVAPRRRMPVGAEVVPGGVHFRVWAPKHASVEVVLENEAGAFALKPEDDGYFAGLVGEAKAGTRYRFRLGGGGGKLWPDPVSRFQPEGPHGPSEVVDLSEYRWADADWQGPMSSGQQVLYELHVGTFTPGGTWADAVEQLPYLAELGVTVIELMPVSEFPGDFGWSYDGVDLFAPYHGYGTPDDFRRFVDRAHGLGIGVALDVVFNHMGPEANVLKEYGNDYFSKRHITEWGEALNFDGDNAGPVREFVLTNAGYWIEEFHLDGLRVDATQALYDESDDHIVGAIARRVREAARSQGRSVLVIGESEPQHARLVRPPEAGGMGYDLLWSDDFHHTAVVAATGTREGYYGDYLGTPQEFVSVLKRGWLYQGQWNLRQKKRRGTPALDVPACVFLFYLQNHDQIANSAAGTRLHALISPARYRALSALQLLAPATPLIFQGQEYAASGPFLYFGDLARRYAEAMHAGRRSFVTQFPSLATEEMQARVPDPKDPQGFTLSKLDPSERDRDGHTEVLTLYHDLIRLRRDDPVFSARCPEFDGAVLGPEAFALRWFGENDDRLLLVNLGVELRLPVAPEPLLAPPDGTKWRVLWSSEDPTYGGSGTPEPETEEHNWRLKAHAAVAMAPAPFEGDEHRDLPGSV